MGITFISHFGDVHHSNKLNAMCSGCLKSAGPCLCTVHFISAIDCHFIDIFFLHQFCWSCSNPTFLTNATTTKFLNHIRYIFLNYMMSGVPAQFLYCAGFFFLWMFFFTWRDWTEFWKCYTDYKLMKSIVKKGHVCIRPHCVQTVRKWCPTLI